MFLAIDAGNTNVTFGFYDQITKKWMHEYRINTLKELTVLHFEREIHLFFLENDIKANTITAVGISSVVPEINEILQQFCKEYLGKIGYFIQAGSYQKLKVSTSRPSEMGTDLMCNVTAAFEMFKSPTIIVDFGTALTFTVVGNSGKVLGVNIVPGLKTAVKALFANTSKLPEVELMLPESALGKDTIHSIQAGILYGYSGLVKGLLETIQTELGYKSHIIATGGLSSILPNLEGVFDIIDRNLTLEGIRLITLVNQ